jgi:hypothetical protein
MVSKRVQVVFSTPKNDEKTCSEKRHFRARVKKRPKNDDFFRGVKKGHVKRLVGCRWSIGILGKACFFSMIGGK